MKLTWLGHACFVLEQDGYAILLDPYTGVEGYPPLEAAAHQVFCSHQHFDHNAVEVVRMLPARESPFTAREIPAFHDGQGGALRGENTIRVFSAEGIAVAHLGDLGHQLSPEQIAVVGPVDLVMVPQDTPMESWGDPMKQFVFHTGPDTQFYTSAGDLKEGALLNIYHKGIATRSLPPQGVALEVRPLAQ